MRAGGAGTRTTGARTTPASRSSSSARPSRNGTRPVRSRTRWRGRSTPTRRPWSPPRPRAAGPSAHSTHWRQPSGSAVPHWSIHGDDDHIAPLNDGRPCPTALGSPLDTVIGGGHCVNARHPVWFNLRLRRFVEEVAQLMRALEPDLVGAVDNDGVSIHYEVFGSGPTTVFLMPTFPIVDSRMWKAQVPYLARHFRVLTADPRGHGRSDRPQDPAAYGDDAYASDVIAVLDATGTESAFLVSLCLGAKWAVMVAAAAPEPGARTGLDRDRPRGTGRPRRRPSRSSTTPAGSTTTRLGRAPQRAHGPGALLDEGLRRPGRVGARRPTRRRLGARFAVTQATDRGVGGGPGRGRRSSCPVLVMHGTEDDCQNPERGTRFAELSGGRLVVIEGAGHLPWRDTPCSSTRRSRSSSTCTPLLAPRATPWFFAAGAQAPGAVGLLADRPGPRVARPRHRPGPARAGARPGDRVAGAVAGDRGARGRTARSIHPASAELASESAHWESEAAAHDLHAFYAFRRMDEILCANYMLFDDVVRETPYDLWVGDESLGGRPLPAREPGAQDRAVRLPDRRGRLPPRRPRGRPAGGRALRRLQRRDDRAPRAVPTRAGPVGVHRRLRRAARRVAGFGAAPTCATGPSAGSPASRTSSRSTPAPTAGRSGCVASSGTAPATRSTSPRSAAPPWAGTSSSSPPRRSRWSARRSRTRGW